VVEYSPSCMVLSMTSKYAAVAERARRRRVVHAVVFDQWTRALYSRLRFAPRHASRCGFVWPHAARAVGEKGSPAGRERGGWGKGG